jgi:hypothetical protein
MKTNWIKPFIYSAGAILLAAALTRFIIAAGHHPALALPDPLLGIPLRYAILTVGLFELAVACFCLFGRNTLLQRGWLAWLATNFVVYQIGLVCSHVHPQATCLGGFTDPLALARGCPGVIVTLLPWYLVLGSYAALAAPWLGRRKAGPVASQAKPGSASDQSQAGQAPAYVRFLKIACNACGGHIEFPTNFFGEQIPCPHCRAVVTLQKAANLKMTCPACQGHLQFPDHALGQKIPCPHCETEIVLRKAEIGPPVRQAGKSGNRETETKAEGGKI